MATPEGWSRNSGWVYHPGSGWESHPELGGVCREEYACNGYRCWDWFWCPPYAADEVRHRKGPYPTLREAAQAAEKA